MVVCTNLTARCFDQTVIMNFSLSFLYAIDHQTSGFVGGLNNTIQVIKRRCYSIGVHLRPDAPLSSPILCRLSQRAAVGATRPLCWLHKIGQHWHPV